MLLLTLYLSEKVFPLIDVKIDIGLVHAKIYVEVNYRWAQHTRTYGGKKKRLA